MTVRIKLRRGTTSEWNTANPVLDDGEVGVQIDPGVVKFKIGDGTTHWSALPYYESASIPLTQRGAANGVASLDSGGKIPDTQIPDAIARDSEVTTAVTTAVNTAVTNLVNGAPGSLDTLNELAAAIGNDPSFSTTVTNSIASNLATATRRAIAFSVVLGA